MVLLSEILAGHLTHICGSETMDMCVFSLVCFSDMVVVIIVLVIYIYRYHVNLMYYFI